MRIVWNEQSFNWFVHASEYTGYNSKMADLLLKYMPQGGSLCDMGCGAALIDFELSPFFDKITCVDISPKVIHLVNEQIRRCGHQNITALCSDGRIVEGSWDFVMALFYGGTDSVECYLKKAQKALIIVTHGTENHNIGTKKHNVKRNYGVNFMREFLEKKNIRYTMQEAALEYGQPFTDIDDAKAFVKAYAISMDESEIATYLEYSLQKTGRDDFPYYLPNERKFGIFVIQKSENENIL